MSGLNSKLVRFTVPDEATQRALDAQRRAHDDIVAEPILQRRTITVTLPNATAVTTKHGLGRKFENFVLSPPIGATATGRIVETAGDSSTEFILTATGHGATITVRVTIW